MECLEWKYLFMAFLIDGIDKFSIPDKDKRYKKKLKVKESLKNR